MTDELEYYYVTYSCIGILSASGIIRQRKVEGRAPGDFNIAGASDYLYRLLEVPCIVQSWQLISKKRAEELNAFAGKILKEVAGGAVKTKDNVTHLRVVPKPKEAPEVQAPPIEPGPFAPKG